MEPLDLLTLGESLIRFSVPVGHLLADCPAYDVHVAGAESNVAVAVARMGYRVRWLSRLTDNVLGQRIVRELTGYGVDCSGVAWTPEDRVGTYFLEFGSAPRSTTVIYDRAESAASKMAPDTFDLSQIANARALHLTGITPALSDSCFALVRDALEEAARHAVPVVFDVNFRARLWPAQTCAETLAPLFERVNTLILGKQDAETVFGLKGDPADILNAFSRHFGIPRVALTLAEAGAMGLERGVTYPVPGYPVQIVDRIGAGDAFAAGIICGLLENDFALGLKYGTAMSALKLSIHGDMLRLGRQEVMQLMDSQQKPQTSRPIR